jgi:DnaJ-domain-containing protein 1
MLRFSETLANAAHELDRLSHLLSQGKGEQEFVEWKQQIAARIKAHYGEAAYFQFMKETRPDSALKTHRTLAEIRLCRQALKRLAT